MTEPALPDEVELAIAQLLDRERRVAASAWPPADYPIEAPGLYSWWVDATGARHLSHGLGQSLAVGLIYAGQTGATKWPSGRGGSGTLATRIGS